MDIGCLRKMNSDRLRKSLFALVASLCTAACGLWTGAATQSSRRPCSICGRYCRFFQPGWRSDFRGLHIRAVARAARSSAGAHSSLRKARCQQLSGAAACRKANSAPHTVRQMRADQKCSRKRAPPNAAAPPPQVGKKPKVEAALPKIPPGKSAAKTPARGQESIAAMGLRAERRLRHDSTQRI